MRAAAGARPAAGVAPPRRVAAMHVLPWPEDEDERILRTLERELPSSVQVIVPEDGAVLLATD